MHARNELMQYKVELIIKNNILQLALSFDQPMAYVKLAPFAVLLLAAFCMYFNHLSHPCYIIYFFLVHYFYILKIRNALVTSWFFLNY